MCKLIVWMVAEKKDKGTLTEDIVYIEDFFIVYIKGLQGFGEKIQLDVKKCIDVSSQELYESMCQRKDEVFELKTKLAL